MITQLVVWSLAISTLWGQTYELQTGQELGLTGGGVGLSVTSGFFARDVKLLTPEEIAQLDPDEIMGMYRWVTRQFSVSAQKVSDVFLYSSFAMPATLYLDQPARTEAGKVGLLYLETLLITTGLTNLVKVAVRRKRPFMYNDSAPIDLKMKKSAQYSFFSGHTSVTASMSFLTAKLYHDFYPDSSARPYVWATAAIIPALTGYLRIRGGKHFVTDVVVGYAVGALVGILVPQIHKIPQNIP